MADFFIYFFAPILYILMAVCMYINICTNVCLFLWSAKQPEEAEI